MALRRVILPLPPAPLRGGGVPRGLGVGLLAAAGFFLWVATTGGLSLYAGALVLLGLVAWAVWRWPVMAAVAVAALMYLQGLIPLVIFGFSHSALLARAFGLWDDACLAILLLRVIHDALLRRQAPRLRYVDLLILFFVGLSAFYVFYPGTLPGNTLYNRFGGFRFDAYFLLAYFVGRGLTLKPQHVRWLLLAPVPAALATAAVAVWQWIALDQSNAFFQRLGFGEFMQAVGGGTFIASRSRELATGIMPRAAGLLLGDLALAFYQVFMIPLAAALFFSLRRRAQRAAAGLFLLAMVSTLALTGNRAAIAMSLVTLLLLTFWGRAYGKTFVPTLTLAAMAILFFLVSGLTGGSLRELFSAEEGSAQGHIEAVQTSLDFVLMEPLGQGLGTAGPVAVSGAVKVRGGLNTESWYLQLGAEIGIAGVVLFFLSLLAATTGAFISYLKVKDPWLRALTLGMAGAGAGFILMGAVHHVWWISTLTMLFWLMMGIAVRAPELERSWGEAGAEGDDAELPHLEIV